MAQATLFDFVTFTPRGKTPRKGWKSARQGVVIHVSQRFIKVLGESGKIYHGNPGVTVVTHPFELTKQWIEQVRVGLRTSNDF